MASADLTPSFRVLEEHARRLLKHRAALLVVVALLALSAAAFLPRLRFDFSPQQLFMSVSDDFSDREEFADKYGREDNLVFVRVAAPDIFAPDVLRSIWLATRALDTAAGVEAADSIATMSLPRKGADPGALELGPLFEDETAINDVSARTLRELILAEPLARGRLVNEAGTKTLIVARLPTEVQSVDDIRTSLDVVSKTLRDPLDDPSIDWALRGLPPMRTRVVDELFADQMTFVPLIGVIYVFILAVLFRRFSGIVLPMTIVGFSLLCLLGLMAVVGATLNIINNVLPALLFVIGASDSIHMLQRDAEESVTAATRDEAVARTLAHTGLACLLTSVTTAVGFYSLSVAETRLLQEFSWEAGTGVLFAFGATIALCAIALPMLEPVRRGRSVETDGDLIASFGRRVLARPRMVAIGSLIAIVASIALARTIRIDSSLLDIFSGRPEVHAVTEEIASEFGGVLPIEISLAGTEPGTFHDPARYAKLRQIQRFAEQQPEVLSTQSIVDFHQPVRALLLGDPAEREVMPDSREQIAQIQLVLDGAPAARQGTDRFVQDEFRDTRVLLRVSDAGGRALRGLSERLKAHLDETFGDDPEVSWKLTGDAYIAARSFDVFVRDLLESLAGAFVVIFLLMALVFRSPRLAIIAMVPNVVPLLVTGAYMALADIPLDVTTTTTFAIGLGLAVDDTIHFVARFREERRVRATYDALIATYAGTGRAIMLTSILLLSGMAVLQLSSFSPTQTFSTLMMLTIGGAVLADLVILPPLLLLFAGEEDPHQSQQTSSELGSPGDVQA